MKKGELMSTYTTYKNLEKPLSAEKYDINVANKNNDIIDSELHKLDLKNQSQDNLMATKESLNEHISDENNPHKLTKSQVNLGNVDNTSDLDKPVSIQQQNAIDEALKQADYYTDAKIEQLINGATTFTEAATRTNISSGEKLSIIFGKIMKWFADLKTVAFSGSYDDLSDKPTIPSLTTSLAATVQGQAALDSTMGKVLDDKGKKINVYVEDGSLHFTDWDGADTVIPFSGSGCGELKINIATNGDVMDHLGNHIYPGMTFSIIANFTNRTCSLISKSPSNPSNNYTMWTNSQDVSILSYSFK